MLDNRKEATDALARAMSDALTNGLTTDDIGEIAQMLAAQQPLALDYSAQHVAERANGADDLPIYTELPEGLIDLPSACEVFGKSRQLLFQWVTQGRLPERGLFKPRGRTVANVVVSEKEVEDCINGTDGWPERRTPKLRKVGDATIGADGLPIYTELPEGLIDLPTAMRKYGCRRGRLDSWVKRGHLEVRGRLRGAAPGGGYLVVSEAEVVDRLETTAPKGGRLKRLL